MSHPTDSHPIKRRFLAAGSLVVVGTSQLGDPAHPGLTTTPFLASPVAPASPAFSAEASVRTLPATTEVAPAFSGDEAYRHVRALAEGIGPRVAGRESQQRAADYLAEQFRHLGYQTELQPFTITSYDDRGSTVLVGGALGR